MSSLLDLSGKVALVTGGARGIGRAIAENLAAHGSDVLLTARNADAAEAAADVLRSAHGRKALGLACDVRDNVRVSAVYKTVFSEFKRLDVLVNNAGVLGDGLLGMLPDAMIEGTLATNVKGLIYNLQSAVRLMRRSGGGTVINIASIIGTRGNAGQVVYAASKSAVCGLTLAAAKELAPYGIRVNAIAPGYIRTDMIAHLPGAMHEERVRSIAMGRIGEPEDVARVALFLASDLSAYVTGQIIGVDGGMVI